MNDRELYRKGLALRKQMLRLIVGGRAGHAGGGLSCIDILNVLYNRVLRVSPETVHDRGQDRFVPSNGHGLEALYTVLSDRGFLSDADLHAVCCSRSQDLGHCARQIPGIERNTRALDLGLSGAAGMALAAKLDRARYRVFTLLGDGELADGSNWEAALAAAHYRLGNLIAILDENRLRITSPTRDVISSGRVGEKWDAFGWEVREVDGHDYAELTLALDASGAAGTPIFVIAHTIEGKGVSFIANGSRWHHGVPSEAELHRALAELDAEEAALAEGALA